MRQHAVTVYAMLRQHFARPYKEHNISIYPIVLCSYPTPRTPVAAWHQVAFPHHMVLDFHCQVVQLNRLDWRTYAQHPNPLAVALMARMRIAPADRVRVKLECLRLLIGLGLDPAQQRLIGAFVGIYLPLTATEEQQFQ